jgi:hypothetical protein
MHFSRVLTQITNVILLFRRISKQNDYIFSSQTSNNIQILLNSFQLKYSEKREKRERRREKREMGWCSGLHIKLIPPFKNFLCSPYPDRL